MNTSKKKSFKLAIIGASSGQLPLVKKAQEMGLYTICFAWDKGAICKNFCDEFYPISIFETDKIIQTCKRLMVDGVVSTASEETSLISSIIAAELGLNGTPPEIIKQIQDKHTVRTLTHNICGLSKPATWSLTNLHEVTFPCVAKPIKGSAKKGVCFCNEAKNLNNAISYAKSSDSEILIEEYIPGDEYSVETLSYHGAHHIIQITRKISTGYPHFAELEHHQPAQLEDTLRDKINGIITKVLSKVGYTDGASHIEIKINNQGIYLIEINPRGGGDHISDTLTGLSTDCDYLAGIIDIALNRYVHREVNNISYCGILYLTAQNSRILKYFDNKQYEWMVERYRLNQSLTESCSNYDRDGYIIYKSSKPLNL